MRNQLETNAKKGSILIWTVLLGMVLTTVFFYFSTRLQGTSSVSRNAMEYQAGEAYLDSYLNYLQTLDFAELTTISSPIIFDNMTITLDNEVAEITGVIDFEEIREFELDESHAIEIEWNICPLDTENGFITTSPTPISTPIIDCSTSDYNNKHVIAPLIGPLTVTNKNSPTSFRIRSQNHASGEKIDSNTWSITGKMNLGYGRKIQKNITYTP